MAGKLPTGILPPGSKPVFQPLFRHLHDRPHHRPRPASGYFLFRFVEDKVLPGIGVDSSAFWGMVDAIVADLAPRNIALLAERDRLQTELDTWHKGQPRPIKDMVVYRGFSKRSATWCPACRGEGHHHHRGRRTGHPGWPQLVVPILNARYALNAANARWGSRMTRCTARTPSGETDGAERDRATTVRGAKVIEFARQVLDAAHWLRLHKTFDGLSRSKAANWWCRWPTAAPRA